MPEPRAVCTACSKVCSPTVAGLLQQGAAFYFCQVWYERTLQHQKPTILWRTPELGYGCEWFGSSLLILLVGPDF